MILLEKKLDIFNKIIYGNKKRAYGKKISDIKNSNQNAVEEYKKNLIEEYNRNLKNRTRKAEQKSVEKLRTAEQENRRELLILRENILKELVETVTEKIISFSNTEDYKEKLIKDIDKNINNLNYDIILLVLQKDYDCIKENYKKIQKIQKIQTIPNNFLGGFMIQDIKKTVNFDYTYLSKMQDYKHGMGEKLNKLITGGVINE